MAEISSQQVREVAYELGQFTMDDLASRLPVKTYKGKRYVRGVVKSFKKRGEITLLKPGIYLYRGRQTPLPKVAKMWRAMRIKEYFTRRDLVMLTGSSKIHAKKYVLFLKSQGFIAHVSGQGHEHALYRLVDPENAPVEHPRSPM